MKQDDRATLTVDKGLRDKIKQQAAAEGISVYRLVAKMFAKYLKGDSK
jgi:predicted DNA binding CopG/RHH family protein